LIVDDSRAARTFLTRVLERYELEVDSAASAEEAIDYLIRQRPDVIFLDHLMPGMDGFQALSVIKNDPRTATIPVMMYTSQEGELYLSQARALGAMGVLPKQTRPADVSRALEQLRLLGERRPESDIATVRVPSLHHADAPPESVAAPEPARVPAPPASGLTPEMRAQLDLMLRDHGIELRRFVTQSLAQNTGQIISEVRALLDDSGEREAALPPEGADGLPERARAGGAMMWLSAVAGAIALFAAVLWYHAANDRNPAGDLRADSSAAGTAPGPNVAPPPPPVRSPVRARRAAENYTALLAETVPYGEPPFSGARTDVVQDLLTRLVATGFRGTVEIRSIPGRFCLQTAGDAVTLPVGDLNYSKCDQLGNPFESGNAVESESVGFANMLNAQHTHSRGAFDVQLVNGNADEVATPYPMVSPQLTAGEWNRVAAANNRVEVRAHPQP
jgi:CheY-like chemotaxis protein